VSPARSAAVLLLAAFARADRHAVLIDIDGVRRDTFAEAFDSGRLPNLARIFAGAVWFDNASTVVPSVTMAAQASIVTGTPPSRHGVPGNQWYDRETGYLFDYMNAAGISCTYGFAVLEGPQCLAGLGNRHLQAPTMYEAAAAAGLASIPIFNQYWKGAARPGAPTTAEATAFLKNNALDYAVFDRKMTDRALAELRARGLPAILTLYYAGADGIGHKQGIGAQGPYLAGAIDPMLGEVLDVIAGLDPEWRSNTLFVLTADHGRTDVTPHPEDKQLAATLAAAVPQAISIAANGGVGYIYLRQPNREMLPVLAGQLRDDPRFSTAVASIRARTPDDPQRSGDLIVTLREGHYFGNPGIGSHHGGIQAGDLGVPLVVASPGAPPAHVAVAVSITQIARTIADYLGFPMESADPPLPVKPRGRVATRQ